MISLDLARKLKLKPIRQNQVKVSGLGGISTQITASADVKITLGSRDWMGMDFMFRAGMGVCVREGLVQLPDGESILTYD
ncbi:hypothetical protein PHMEG_00024830 [Phytophthora megakarya]|uniref:Eukaryotic/viral aspartic protease n=1 Tax=Phytophthora megakarya TaxID=4795 RepID=A0A225VES3_9STRA|nr:hypothetical protein PHMEG_00024830 [Phytophthora megakarya]